MGLFLGIAAVIAIGALVAYIVKITYNWFKDRIRQLAAKTNVKKVVACELETLIEKCPNQQSLEQFLQDDSDMVFATVDNNNRISNVEIVHDSGDGEDYETIEGKLGSDGMLVVNC